MLLSFVYKDTDRSEHTDVVEDLLGRKEGIANSTHLELAAAIGWFHILDHSQGRVAQRKLAAPTTVSSEANSSPIHEKLHVRQMEARLRTHGVGWNGHRSRTASMLGVILITLSYQ